MYKSINPSNNEVLSEYPLCTEDLESLTDRAAKAQSNWKDTDLSDKLNIIKNFKTLLHTQRDELAKLISLEMGKLFKTALGEILRIEQFADFIIENASEILTEKNFVALNSKVKAIPDPLGIIFSITPWNVPMATPIRHILPAIITGNAIIVKPAPNVAGSALAICKLLYEAGVPSDLVQIALLSNEQAELLIANKRISKITFVGSTAVGRRLAGIAGQNIKPILLELGGSDPFIILSGCNIKDAVSDLIDARLANSGQVCCSPKRVIVEAKAYQQAKEILVEQLSVKKSGDPFDPQSDFGPIARKDILDGLKCQVDAAISAGGKILLKGGQRGATNFFDPVLIEMTDTEFDQEFFGPVFSLYSAASVEDAISIANSTQYGLGATIYSNNNTEAESLARKVKSGFVYINSKPGLNPYIPFGGVKNSGFGKDCGDAGLLEFINLKPLVRTL